MECDVFAPNHGSRECERRNHATWVGQSHWPDDFALSLSKLQVESNMCSNADAVVEQQNGLLLFVEPYERHEPFVEFLDYIQADSRRTNVKYAQTRKSNDII